MITVMCPMFMKRLNDLVIPHMCFKATHFNIKTLPYTVDLAAFTPKSFQMDVSRSLGIQQRQHTSQYKEFIFIKLYLDLN